MIQQEVLGSASAHPAPDARVGAPLIAPAAQPARGGWLAAPVITGVCCLGLILFLIASTIVLSLIPLYLSTRNGSPSQRRQQVTLLIPIVPGQTFPVGNLNAQQQAILQNYLQQRLNSKRGGASGSVKVLSARGIRGSGRKRQVTDFFVEVIAIVIGVPPDVVISFTITVTGEPLPGDVAASINSATTVITTTAITTTTTSANASRALVRRSSEEGGAPAGIVYVDSHQIAETKGTVSTVSFYVDRTCALATVEFGAFDIINRDTDMNKADLVLTHRSGPLKLGSATELKPYMNLITIELCNENEVTAANGRACKGIKFPVEPHQYIGIRSDKCRLGFAPTSTNPLYAATWKPEDESDPFVEPYQTVKYGPSDYTVLHLVTIEPTISENKQAIKQDASMGTNSPRVLFVGSYPPRRCGLAKFLEDLTDSYPGPHSVVAVDEQNADLESRNYSEKVIYRLNQADRDAYYTLANIINTEAYDVLNLQHEYGLYGGLYSEYVLNLLSSVRKPIVITLHTVIPDPNPFVIGITRAICALSSRVVVFSNLGRRLLVDLYGVDESKLVIIPHGVPDVAFDNSLADNKAKLGFDSNAPTMSTFGLIHRNKNIQLALKAMQTIVKSIPNMMYLVIGQTHPIIQKYEGEAYRNELEGNVTALGLSKNVRFINEFVDNNELLEYLGASDIFLTPYAREDQYVSGTLSWAVGLGKVVISTPYLYAKELLADGRGFLVPFEDADFMSSLIVKVVQNDAVRNATRYHAYKYGRKMAWPHVAKDFEELFREELLFT